MKNSFLLISLLAIMATGQLHGQINWHSNLSTQILTLSKANQISSNYFFIGLTNSQLPSGLLDMELSSVSKVSGFYIIDLTNVTEPKEVMTLKELANQTTNLEAQQIAKGALQQHRAGTALTIGGALTTVTGVVILVFGDVAAIAAIFGAIGISLFATGVSLLGQVEKNHEKALYKYNNPMPQLNAQNMKIGWSISF